MESVLSREGRVLGKKMREDMKYLFETRTSRSRPILAPQNHADSSSVDVEQDGGGRFPNIIGDPGLSNPTIHKYFNTAAFAQPAAFTFGNAGRNILVGPGMSDLDFSMAKSLAVPKLERGRLQLRFDATNIINHPSFSNPNASIGTPNAGIITSTTIGGRVVQLGARLSF